MDRKILKRQTTTLYNNDIRHHLFNFPGVYQLLIIACIAADGITLFKLIDLFLTQAPEMSYVITIAVAGVLNIAAVLLAACVRNQEFTVREKKVFSTLLVTVFVLFFTALFGLRIASMEEMYAGTAGDVDADIMDVLAPDDAVQQEAEFKPNAGQVIMAVTMGLEPLGTSALCFFIGYEQSPIRKRRYLQDKHVIELKEELNRVKVMIAELKADMEFNLNAYDLELYANTVAVITQQGKLSEVKADRWLTEDDGTPEGVTYIMEGEYLKQKGDGAEAPRSGSPEEVHLSKVG